MTAISLVNVTKTFPDGTVAVDGLNLEARSGEFLVLLGPSGCGKSTALRIIAGLETITSGELLFDGNPVDTLPPRERNVAMVFQSLALYPHLDVRRNIGFSLRVRKQPEEAVDEQVTGVAVALGLGDYLHRGTHELSGGQRQRVAMARAMVRRPAVFLMDEPLSDLDMALRAEMRAEITRQAKDLGSTTVYVTHDQTEALTMADRIAVMRAGVLQQVGTPAEIYRSPQTAFVAAFVGTPAMNLLEAVVRIAGPEEVDLDLGTQFVRCANARYLVSLLAPHRDKKVILGFRPEAATLAPADAHGTIRGTVERVEHLGHEQLLYVGTGSRSLRIQPATQGQKPAASRVRRFRQYESMEEDLFVRSDHSGHRYSAPDVVLRCSAGRQVLAGESISIGLDLDGLHFFDRTGRRITHG